MISTLRVGVGRTDVTPPLGTQLGGYPVQDRPAESIHDPLHSTALVLSQDAQKAAIISLDWLSIDEEDTAIVRQGVYEQTGIKPANVTVCAIQTHTAANTVTYVGWGDKEAHYISQAVPKIVESVVQADKQLSPVRVGIGTTKSKVGVCRRGILEHHGATFVADPSGIYDPTMTVVRFEGASKPVATVVHYGAHNTAMSDARTVSRDWAGVMIDRIEQQTGAPAMFICGAVGDVGPRTNSLIEGGFSAGAGDGPSAAMEVGYRGASDALWTWQSIKDFRTDLALRTLTETITLPYAPLPPLQQARDELAAAAPQKDQWGPGMCNYGYWRAVVEAHTRPPTPSRAFAQTITALGPIALVPFPGEPFSGILLRLRAYSPFQYTLGASTTNGELGYFVTREARHRGGYEIWASQSHGAYLFAENIDDVLVEENLKLLRKIPHVSV